MALLLDAGGQLDAGMSFKPLTSQQQCTCLTIKVYEAPVSVFCPGKHKVCVASTQDEKCTETEDQKRPEKNSTHAD